jgi:glycerate dehydrogenase
MKNGQVLVATIPGMIEEVDLEPIRKLASVKYHEADSISQSELARMCSGYDVLMLNYDIIGKLDANFYADPNVQSLVAISTDITGMDWSTPAEAKEQGVTLQHIPHYSTESVAETTLFEVLLHSRQRLLGFRDMIKGLDPEGRQGINLKGRTAGIVGFGSIGQRVSEMLGAIGMNVKVWNRSARPGLQIVSLKDIFDSSDVICLTMATEMAGTDSNRGLVSQDLLSGCKEAIIINLAGPHLVNTDDMVTALKTGRVSGYSVEGTDELKNSELATLPQVHLPPHNSWKSPESLENLKNIWISNTISALEGHPENIFKLK